MHRIRAIVLGLVLTSLFSTGGGSYHQVDIVSAPKPKTYKPIAPLTQIKHFELASELQPVYVPPPPPPSPPATSTAPAANTGCVTGYSSGDYYLDKIIGYESSGNSCATNYLGCFGLLQACPGEPLREACGGNPSCQIAWFQQNKTGGRSWALVWQHELQFGWW